MKKESGILEDVQEEDLELLKSNPEKFWEGVTEIGKYAFLGQKCKNLTEITIPGSVKRIGESAFGGSYVTKVTILEGTQFIGRFAFPKSLSKITIPNSVTKIKSYAFCETSLTKLTLPKGITEIPAYLCKDCVKLTKVSIPTSVTKIENLVFENCHQLQEITIPKSVTEIGYGVFNDCDELTVTYGNVKVPATSLNSNSDFQELKQKNEEIRKSKAANSKAKKQDSEKINKSKAVNSKEKKQDNEKINKSKPVNNGKDKWLFNNEEKKKVLKILSAHFSTSDLNELNDDMLDGMKLEDVIRSLGAKSDSLLKANMDAILNNKNPMDAFKELLNGQPLQMALLQTINSDYIKRYNENVHPKDLTAVTTDLFMMFVLYVTLGELQDALVDSNIEPQYSKTYAVMFSKFIQLLDQFNFKTANEVKDFMAQFRMVLNLLDEPLLDCGYFDSVSDKMKDSATTGLVTDILNIKLLGSKKNYLEEELNKLSNETERE